MPMFESYIRSLVQISENSPLASGYRFTAKQALNVFGDYLEEIDKSISNQGSFICFPYQRYYQKFLHSLLTQRKMTYGELDKIFKFNDDLRNNHIMHSIWDWVKVCNYFNIEIISLGVLYDQKTK